MSKPDSFARGILNPRKELPRGRIPPSMFPQFDKLGEQHLLSQGAQDLTRNINENGQWNMDLTAPIKGNGGLQGFRILLESRSSGERYLVPLCAKQYAVWREEATWYSVSETILESSRRYGSDLVLTFVQSLKGIRVSHAKAARDEGGYLRFGERYRGWFVRDTLSLCDWLRNPSGLTYQEILL